MIPYLEIPHERVSGVFSLQSTLFQFSLSLGMSFGALLLQGLLTAQGFNCWRRALRLKRFGRLSTTASLFAVS